MANGSILLRRGPTVDRLAFTPLDGELIFDTDLKKVFVGDGQTVGGVTISSDTLIDPNTGALLNIPISSLQASTISGVSLGQNLKTLTFDTGLTGGTYNGSTAVTVSLDASTTANGKIVLRDSSGNFTAGTITANITGDISGNAGTVTNGVYTTGSYDNPSWITSLSETKVLPSQTGNAGRYLTTNGTVTGWAALSSVGFPSVVGNAGKFLTTDGSAVSWGTVNSLPSQTGNIGKYLKTNGTSAFWATVDGGDSANTPGAIVSRDSSGNFAAGTITANIKGSLISPITSSTIINTTASPATFTGNLTGDVVGSITNPSSSVVVVNNSSSTTIFTGDLTGNVTGNITGNANTVTNGVYTTGSYSTPSWITALSIAQGGTGGNSQITALTNLLPTGEASGYVLKTTGRGSYFWAAESGGSGTVGTTLSTARTTFTATASQTLFTSVPSYTPGSGQLRIYIDGVRQFPSEYTETSSTSFTMGTGLPAGTKVFVEIDSTVSTTIDASTVTFSPAGNIASTNVQLAITELDLEKAPLNNPTFTGTVGGLSASMVGLGNVDNTTDANKPVSTATQTALDLKAPKASPTFSGTVAFAASSTVNFSNATVSGLPTVSAFPSGTKLVFAQTSAPTGWTKDTTHNDKAMRVVSGTAGSGGTVNFSSAFTTQGVAGTVSSVSATGTVGDTVATGSVGVSGSVSVSGNVGGTTLSSSQMPSHTHTPSNTSHQFVTNDFPAGTSGWTFGTINTQGNMNANGGGATASTGGGLTHNHTWGGSASFSGSGTFTGSAHNHSFSGNSHSHTFSGTSIDLSVKYVDVIIATKD